MTLDEAINKNIKMAELQERLLSNANDSLKEIAMKFAAEYRQLAEWLTELKEAKRLLKAATGIIKDVDCNEDYLCDECEYRAKCDGGFSFYWRYANEAFALIGEDTNVGSKIDSWISCKDKMPEDNTSVLFVYVSENGIKSVHYGYHQTVRGLGSSWGKISGGWRYCNDDVTHWMPIPEPPKDGDANV